MASLASFGQALSGRGNLVPPAFRFKAKMNFAHVKKKVKSGNLKALDRAGTIVRQSSKKQFSHRKVKPQPNWSLVGRKDGMPVLAMDFRPPIPGKITSWKNPRGRGATQTGFLRTLIRYAVDNRRESVVIGPTDAATWLNKLQEFGGSSRRVLRLVGRYPTSQRRPNRVLEKFQPPDSLVSGGRSGGRDKRGRFKRNLGRGAYVGVWIDPAHTRRRKTMDLASSDGRVPPGRFMKKGLAAKLPKLAQQWRGQISGP
jgi:hypothetical protein